MRKIVFAAAFAAACAALALDPPARPPDSKGGDGAAYARRGALGADDYVATNVYPNAYRLARSEGGALADRAVNSAAITGTNAVFTLPERRAEGGYARAFILFVDSRTDATVRFAGARHVYTTDAADEYRITPGRSIFTAVEIADDEYLVEWRELTETRN